MQTISTHCFAVARYLHEKLLQLHHANGKPVVILYCDNDFSDASLQGNIVNFNIIRHNGEYVGFAEVIILFHVCIHRTVFSITLHFYNNTRSLLDE